MSTVGENQLQRIIRDLHDAVTELCKEHCEMGEPITDDSPNLHKFCYKLEYLLQFDQKEKRSFLGGRKDYWDYFCACLAKIKGANDGIRFVKSIPELKTSLGKGRSFIRYGLVHQRLADTLQQCVMNYEITCDWFYERSPFLKSHLNIDIINHLYELNEVQFDVASRGHDLDSDWPTFARKTLGSAVSSTHVWKPPSRCSSVNSLASSFSQQTQELISGQDFSLLSDLGELGELSCTASDDVRFELDQSELKQKELLEKIRLLTSEAADLRALVKNIEEQLSDAKTLNPEKGVPSTGAEEEAFKTVRECTDRLQTTTQELEALREQEASERSLEAKLNVAENRNMELLAKLDGALSEKEQQAASYCDSAWKIQELLTKLKEAERERIEYKRESEDRSRLAERLAQELKQQEVKLKEVEGKLDALNASADKERADELQMTVNRLQGALSLKERETGNLCTQLQDMQSKLEVQESQLEEMKKKTQEELTLKSELEERLKAKETELSVSLQKIQKVENDNQRLAAESQRLQTQAKKLEEYKNQCTSLMEINAKLIQTVKSNQESCKEPAHTKNTETGLESAENQHLEKCVPNGQVKNEKPENENEELGVAGKEKRTLKLDKLDEHAAVSQEHKKQSCSHLHDANESSTSKHKESTSRLALAEAQLDLNMKEVSRVQEEVLDLRAQLLVSSEERVKIQTLQEVTEASREDFRAQTEQLKTQVEELNRRHVEELMRCQGREENLIKERNKESKAQTRLQTMVNTMREELDVMKKQNDTLTLENGEAREALYRANTETAELGVQVCMLTGQNEEAQLRWKELSSKLQKVQTEAEMEVKTLRESMEAVSKDNARLQEQLKQTEGLPKGMQELQERLEQAEDETRSLQEIRQREVDTLRSQLSDEAAHHQNQMQHLNEELDELKKKLDIELKKVSSLESKALKLESVNSENSQMIEKKNNLLCDSETIIDQKEEQIKTLTENLSRAEEQLALAQQACHELGVKLDKSVIENQTLELKTSAEIDDLSRTKRDLQERLIELIRDKDALWQKSDALEFEQKLRAEEQTDRDGTYCPTCRSQFGWTLRKYNCRLCGRPYCYYCCSYVVSVQQGGAKERCCKDCFTQHSHPQADPGSPAPMSSPTRTSTPSSKGELRTPQPDDTVFDIISEDEVSGVSDSLYTTALSTDTGQTSSSDITTTDDSDELISSVQDAEICLLKSGEMTLSVPYNMEDVVWLGDESRELFIKSSCYSVILITADHPGPSISWTFSSKPKSISFSVVYRENTETPLEQAKVLIPLTRCHSHKETIQGQLKVRNPGEFTFIFDNSFSRFVSKKVLYKLSIVPADVCNGSDYP